MGVDMNRDIVEGSWKQFKGKVRVRWSMLIGDHLGVVSGRHAQYDGERQSAYGSIRSKTLRTSMKTRYPARLVSPKRMLAGDLPRTASVLAIHAREQH